MTAETVEIPGYIAGTWDIDPVHSHIGFVARHLMVSKVRGNFGKFEGQIVTAEATPCWPPPAPRPRRPSPRPPGGPGS